MKAMNTILWIALSLAFGGLEDRLMSRVDNGGVLSTLSIDRSVVLSAYERVLVVHLRLEGDWPSQNETKAAAPFSFWIERCPCPQPLHSRQTALPMPHEEKTRTEEIGRSLPLIDWRGDPLRPGPHRLYVYQEGPPRISNSIAFEVR